MKKVLKTLIFSAILLLGVFSAETTFLHGQEPLDGRGRPFKDDLVDNLSGDWKITRKMPKRSEENTVHAEWVLDHQFMLLHMKDVGRPAKYEAMIYIGYDNTSERYVAHWIDVLGGRFSETLGYGRRTDNSIKFVFEYPDGPFHNTFTWDPTAKAWSCLLQQKDAKGNWVTFAEDTFRRP